MGKPVLCLMGLDLYGQTLSVWMGFTHFHKHVWTHLFSVRSFLLWRWGLNSGDRCGSRNSDGVIRNDATVTVVMKVRQYIIGIQALKTAFAAEKWRWGRFRTLAPLSNTTRHDSVLIMHTAVGTFMLSNHFCWLDEGSSTLEVD
jgi:hypothetical protein